MGCVAGVGFYRFPKQSDDLYSRVEVCFYYDTSRKIGGTIIRDDREDPYETIIRLDDGRVIRGVECQYSIVIPLRRRPEIMAPD